MARRISKRDKRKFLDALAATGSVVEAADAVERPRGQFYVHREEDPDFAQAWDAARREYLDEVEGQVIDWAMNGYTVASTETVVDAQGQQIGHTKRKIERRYDARLAMRILERRHPDYKPGTDVSVSTPTGVLVVPGTSASEEDWEKTFGADG